MRQKTFVVLVAAALTTALLACNDGGTAGSSKNRNSNTSIALADLPHELAVTFCTLLDECAGPLAPLFMGSNDCVTVLTAQFAETTMAPWAAGIADGSLVFRSDQARACLTALHDLGCGGFNAVQPAVCDQAVEGKVIVGGPCTFTDQCAGNHYCDVTGAGTCPGQCANRKSANAPCDPDRTDDKECDYGMYCEASTSTCRIFAGTNGPCEGGSEPRCSDFLMCVGGDDTTPGVCKSWENVFTEVLDAGCNFDDLLCVPGLSCVYRDDGTGNPEAACANPATGTACNVGLPDPCRGQGRYCDADIVGGTLDGNCILLPTGGMPCGGVFAQCANGFACDEGSGLCVSLQHVDSACTSDTGCFSGLCDNNICATPVLCQ